MTTARERIIEVLKTQQRPLASAELQLLMPEFKAGNIYTTTSSMVYKYKDLKKNSDGKFYLPEWDKQEQQPTETPPPPPPPPTTPLSEVPRGKITFLPHKASKPKIHWTPEERVNLAVATFDIKREKLFAIDVAFDVAQRKVLAPGRRRHITQFNEQVGAWLQPMLDAMARVPSTPVQASQSAQTAPPVPTPQPTQNNSSDALEKLLEPWAKWLKAVMTEAFVDAMSRQIAPVAVPDKEQPAANETPVPVPKHNPEMPETERVRLPRVLVIGIPKPHQQQEIVKEYAGKLDIRYAHTDDPSAMIKQRMAGVDMVIVLKDHCNHRVTETVRFGDVPFKIFPGHITAAKENLTKFYEESKA